MNMRLVALLSALLLAGNTSAASAGKETKHVISSVEIKTSSESRTIDGSDDVYEYEYDEKGRLSKVDSAVYSEWEKHRFADLVYATIIPGIDYYEYNEDDTINRITRKDEKNAVRFTIDYEYDDKGVLQKQIYKNGSKTVTDTYNYDENGVLTQVDRDEGNRTMAIRFGYHDNGWQKNLRYRETIEMMPCNRDNEFHYNDDGNVISIVFTNGNFLPSEHESAGFYFEYNESGDLYKVRFNQGYFQTDYEITYTYKDIEVS